jgi:chromosome segregation protein
MRLSKIKLAGFKSFVDPTTLQLPGNLTGIVGPNGCGKSNTIDAVRWVMGESSAKHLRGESMDDVIFSGSSARKPVGQASVELVFDNSAGKLGGQYANYSEIAVKRQVTRDGQSQYFLNGTKCRRRDITDIFLGTGLGPRSYAIIEQGMISRLIEAKPDDMRVYLEEAAGISKYKERRRETENRIRHTRDNLDRLNDLREEVDKQLGHLQRQSRTAERYKTLKIDEKRVRSELLGLRWLDYQSALDTFEDRLQERQSGVDIAQERYESAETSIDEMREKRVELDRNLNDIQGRFYSLGADITRTEQSIGQARNERRKREEELQRLTKELQEAQDNIRQDGERIADMDKALAEAGPTRDKVERELAEATEAQERAETEFTQFLERWEKVSSEHTEQRKNVQIDNEKATQLGKTLQDLLQRQERAQREQVGLATDKLTESLSVLTSSLEQKNTEEGDLKSRLDSAVRRLAETREMSVNNDRELNERRTELQNNSGRLASLNALQQAALGGTEKSRLAWLKEHGLEDAPPLARLLDIDDGWEDAIEVVLGDFLKAVCVDDYDTLSRQLMNPPDSGVKIVRDHTESHTEDHTDDASDEDDSSGNQWLTTLVSSRAGIDELMHGVTVCETLEEAFEARDSLQPGESVVTRDGVWMGRHWLCARPLNAEGGVVARQEELDKLEAREATLESLIEELVEKQSTCKNAISQAEAERDRFQMLVNARHREISSVAAKIESTRSQMDQAQKRQGALAAELDELSAKIARTRREQTEASESGQAAGQLLQGLSTQVQQLEQEKARVTERRDATQKGLQQVRESGQATIVKLESMKTGRQSIVENLERVQHQHRNLTDRKQELLSEEQPDTTEIEKLQEELELLVESREQIERELRESRQKLEAHDESIRQREQERHRLQQEVTNARELVQKVNMESQESRVRLKTIDEQLVEAGENREELLPRIPEHATIDEWALELEELERKIQRLGPINLAAIEEYQEQLQRKEYLDSQYEDIIEALETLETAIQKIDKETRAMFRETFDIVNNKLQELFPRLFGGGQAKLELTGDDMLNTGVAVMARPPGKRVSSIQLLSGGEKAMTAVALVFAFFHLRPSPFCMLDEVDAPLDDANVGRFAKLVSEMSAQVQFIFITHNKVTMELSTQLMGVTMQEPGVSRLVSVDVDEAVELAVA